METLSPSNAYPGERARRAACNRCRTQKLRCERPSVLPDSAGRASPRPCIRCTRLGTICVTNAPQRLGRPTSQWCQTNLRSPPSAVELNIVDPQVSSSSIPASWEDLPDIAPYYGGTATPRSNGQATTPDLTTIISSSIGSSPELDMIDKPEMERQVLSLPFEPCAWRSVRGIAPIKTPNTVDQPIPNPLMEDAADPFEFQLAGSSMDAIMGTVLRMDTGPFPDEQPRMADSVNRYRQRMELASAGNESNEVASGRALSELLALGTKFVQNVDAYQAAGSTEVEIKRTILQNSLITSGKLLKLLKTISTEERSRASTQETLPFDAHALLTQASSSLLLESRQWHVILGHILLQLRQSPQNTDAIAEIIPNTRMEGMVFNNTLLQARFFLQACLHTTEELCKQLNCVFEVFSEPGLTPLDTKGILKGVKNLHAELLSVLERLHS